MIKIERSFPAPESLLRKESRFAAFKRYYIREHGKKYPELLEYIA